MDRDELASDAYKTGYRDGREDGVNTFDPEAMQEGLAQWMADNRAALTTPSETALEPMQRCPNCGTRFQKVNDVDAHIESQDAALAEANTALAEADRKNEALLSEWNGALAALRKARKAVVRLYCASGCSRFYRVCDEYNELLDSDNGK